MEADPDELGAYFGILFMAGNKRVTNDNRTAFNEKRRASALASVTADPKIFIPGSDFLSDEVLANVYGAFISMAPARANMTARIILQLEKPLIGPALSFMTMFLLLIDTGMSALRIIKEAVIKHPWIRSEYPELRPELAAANEAQQIIKRASGRDRSFLKAIHGANFVPVNYSQIEILLGVCKEVLKRTTPSYQNYGGGKITDAQLQVINNHLDKAEVLVSSASAE